MDSAQCAVHLLKISPTCSIFLSVSAQTKPLCLGVSDSSVCMKAELICSAVISQLSVRAQVLTLSLCHLTGPSAAKAGSSSSSPGPSSSPSPAKMGQGSSLSSQLCDPQHKDCLLREFRKLCATVAENNSYNVKTQIIEKFLKKGSGGGGWICWRPGSLLPNVALKHFFSSWQISSTEIFTSRWSCSCQAS